MILHKGCEIKEQTKRCHEDAVSQILSEGHSIAPVTWFPRQINGIKEKGERGEENLLQIEGNLRHQVNINLVHI